MMIGFFVMKATTVATLKTVLIFLSTNNNF